MNKLFRSVSLVLLMILCAATMQAQDKVEIDATKLKAHPRLLLLQGEEAAIKKNIATQPGWKKVHDDIIAECDSMLTMPVLERKMIGRRLLSVSREALRRLFFLSYAWRTTDKKKYFKRCEEEMLAIAAYTDWNPSHFLDVAEMSMAMAIGYDWLYNGLSKASRDTIRQVLIHKGIEPSLDTRYNGWVRGNNNWNQVCNTGVSMAAAAVYESQPEASRQIIERAVNSIRYPMKTYGPDGNYNEGYSYWAYGTSYNVFFLDLLHKLVGQDYNLSQEPGFMHTASYYEQLIGTSGKPFNYADAGGLEGLQPATLWFASQQKDPSLLYIEKKYIDQGKTAARSNRILPAAMIWGKDIDLRQVKEPATQYFIGEGLVPVALMRTGWNGPKDIYVGFKGGAASASHAHMDAGSFVMDADGERWSSDLGMQGYESLESKGLQIWNMEQNSDRWKVYRYTNYAHSTLTVNGQLHFMKGWGKITSHGKDSMFRYAVMDLTRVLNEQVASAFRGIAIVDKKYVMVRDEIETGADSSTSIRWSMLTPAKVLSINGNQLQLQSNGKKLTMYVHGLPEGTVLKTWPTDPPHEYDALNLGTTLVGFEVSVPAHTKKDFTVFLVPGDGQLAVKKSLLKPLNAWK